MNWQDDLGVIRAETSQVSTPKKTFTGFASNVVRDVADQVKGVKDIGVGLYRLGKGVVTGDFTGTIADPEHAINKAAESRNFLPMVGKTIGGGVAKAVTHPLDTLYERPVSTAMIAAPAIGAAGKLVQTGKAVNALGAPLAGRIARGAETVSKYADPIKAPTAAVAKSVDWMANAGIADDSVRYWMQRARILPTSAKTSTQRQEFYKNADLAVNTIVENQPNLILKGEQGVLPESTAELSEAIHQTKGSIYKQFDDLQREAGQAGMQIETSPIVHWLRQLTENKNFAAHGDPQAIQMAGALYKLYDDTPYISLADAQERIAMLNQKLAAFERNPSVDSVSMAYVNDGVVRALRKSLDDAVTQAKGPGYQTLKNKYGALKSMEDQVAKLATKVEGKKPLIDELFGDRYSGVKIAYGLATAKAPAILAGGAVKGLAAWQKWKFHPDTAINSMFKDIARQAGKRRSPGQHILSTIPGQRKTALTGVAVSSIPSVDED